MTKGTTYGKSQMAAPQPGTRNAEFDSGQLESKPANHASVTRIRVKGVEEARPEGKPGDSALDLIAQRKSRSGAGTGRTAKTLPEVPAADAKPAKKRLTPLASYEYGYKSGYADGEDNQRQLRRRQAEEDDGRALHSLTLWQGCSLFLAGVLVGMLYTILT